MNSETAQKLWKIYCDELIDNGDKTSEDVRQALAPYLNTNSNKLTTNTNPNNCITASSHSVSVKSYDLDSSEHIFLEVAEKVRTKDAKVSSMSVNIDSVGTFTTGLQTFTFEVVVYNTP